MTRSIRESALGVAISVILRTSPTLRGRGATVLTIARERGGMTRRYIELYLDGPNIRTLTQLKVSTNQMCVYRGISQRTLQESL